MELLAPVNADTLNVALESGANAVYFGLKRLNARRGARNFTQQQLPDVVKRIHDAGAKAHLTVNIDLSAREVALAARTLQCAVEAGVDAVIVRDAAILALRPFFPELQFHLSTQAAVSSSAGVLAARELGCSRVVLARELTAEEIDSCGRIPDIEIEVFVQGAMCFSCSGRCLLSSWVGGRSGNRGACASPCRVAWRNDVQSGNPLSMLDLCLLGELERLKHLNVASLKIEGRLKSQDWVRYAVSLYRKALDEFGKIPAEMLEKEARGLGDYTGRRITAGYFNHHFENLTDGNIGRLSTALRAGAQACPAQEECTPSEEGNEDDAAFRMNIGLDEKRGVCIELAYCGQKDVLRIPPQRIANPKRAMNLDEVVDGALAMLPAGCRAVLHWKDESLKTLLLPRRMDKSVTEAVMQFWRNATRADDGMIRIPLNAAAADFLKAESRKPRCAENRLHLGDIPDTLRFNAAQVSNGFAFLESLQNSGHERIVVCWDDGLPIDRLKEDFQRKYSRRELIIAFPQVCYEAELKKIQAAMDVCKSLDIAIEVNSWDAWYMARMNGMKFECGCGMAVLNPLAAGFLVKMGAQCVMASPEADREKLEDLSAAACVPFSITVFSYPMLMQTRVRMPEDIMKGGLRDNRQTDVRLMRENSITAMRPDRPFDWRRVVNPKIMAAHLVADFSGSVNCLADARPAQAPFLFNYDRELK